MIRHSIRIPARLALRVAADGRPVSDIARAALAACASPECQPVPLRRPLTQLGFRASRRAYDTARAWALVRSVPLQALFAGALVAVLAARGERSDTP